MATSETAICNQALARIGALRINSLDDGSVNAGHCNLHYEQTRDALLRSHWWRFANDRATLSQDTNDPDFEWDNQFDLPEDFLRFRSFFADNNTIDKTAYFSFEIEGNKLLTNEDTVEIRYVKKVKDTSKFDPLFIEVLVLQLAIKLVMPITQDADSRELLLKELASLMVTVRLVDKSETNTKGRADSRAWVDIRRTRGGRIDSRLGSN